MVARAPIPRTGPPSTSTSRSGHRGGDHVHVGEGRRARNEVVRLDHAHHTFQITERLLHAGQGVHCGPLRRLQANEDGDAAALVSTVNVALAVLPWLSDAARSLERAG